VDKVCAPREEISKVRFHQGEGFAGKDSHRAHVFLTGSFTSGFYTYLCNLVVSEDKFLESLSQGVKLPHLRNIRFMPSMFLSLSSD
jgi:hypothetical protein